MKSNSIREREAQRIGPAFVLTSGYVLALKNVRRRGEPPIVALAKTAPLHGGFRSDDFPRKWVTVVHNISLKIIGPDDYFVNFTPRFWMPYSGCTLQCHALRPHSQDLAANENAEFRRGNALSGFCVFVLSAVMNATWESNCKCVKLLLAFVELG